jgi:hypothetical protein
MSKLEKKPGELWGLANKILKPSESGEHLILGGLKTGLELEVEGIYQVHHDVAELISPYWKVVNDGSLRNHGREFVMTGPQNGVDLENAIKILDEALNFCKEDSHNRVKYNWRTSLHVHHDCTKLTIKEIGSIVLTYLVFEKILIDYCDSSRQDNIFCAPIYAVDQVQEYLKVFLKIGELHLGEEQKYSALNVGALRKFGSLEFRMHHGTHSFDEIIQWLNILGELRDAGRKMHKAGTLLDLPSVASSEGFYKFYKQCFPKTWNVLKKDKLVSEVENDVLQGVRIVQRVLFDYF